MHVLDYDADRALFEGKLDGIVAACYEDERPLQGLVGLLDWRFQGLISQSLRAGRITGKAGECVYVPITRHGRTFHLILAGAGRLPKGSASRGHLPAESLKLLKKNLASLRLRQIGISRSDLGHVTDDYLSKHLKGVPLWIVP